MATDTERLEQADACHDDDPPRGAELLRTIDAAQLPPERRPSYAFLLNHVLGEKLNHWDEALQRQQQLLAAAQPAPAAVLWRQAATAARLAGAGAEADDMARAFAQASNAPLDRSTELLQLSAAMYQAPGLAAPQAGERVLAALAPLAQAAWLVPNPLDTSVAACANNIASGLLDRPAADLQHATARAALAQGAEQAQRFWQRAGTWVHHERALYLRAMACNALGEPQDARSHAQAALALLDANDAEHAEDIDRAFIELERRHACERLGLLSEAADAARKAQALAGRFDDAALMCEFDRRMQVLAALARPSPQADPLP
jgi:hypothetical protein